MRHHWLKHLPCLASVGLLAACTAPVPPAMMIASQAVDGLSYITTGKSGADHALSAAMSEDCALHRIVTAGAVCQEIARPPVQTASLGGDPRAPENEPEITDPSAEFLQLVSDGGNGRQNVAAAKEATRLAALAPQGLSVPADWQIPAAPRTFVVAATYRLRGEGEKAALRIFDVPGQPHLRPKVVSTLDGGGPVYRLVVGPLSAPEGQALRATIAAKGFASAVVMSGCAGAVSTACVDAN